MKNSSEVGFHCLAAIRPEAGRDVLWFVADYRQGPRPNIHRESAADWLRRHFKDTDKIYWRYASRDEKGIHP